MIVILSSGSGAEPADRESERENERENESERERARERETIEREFLKRASAP